MIKLIELKYFVDMIGTKEPLMVRTNPRLEQFHPYNGGIASTVLPSKKIGKSFHKPGRQSWFTTFNQDLLNKVIDAKKQEICGHSL
jgi:hypothetical protein